MYVAPLSVIVTTNASGAGTGKIVAPNGGQILGLAYVKPGSGGYSNNVTLAVTVVETGQAVATFGAGAIDASLVSYPRAQVHSVAAGATGLTLDGTRVAFDAIPIAAGHTLLFTVAAGGDTKQGTFYALIG